MKSAKKSCASNSFQMTAVVNYFIYPNQFAKEYMIKPFIFSVLFAGFASFSYAQDSQIPIDSQVINLTPILPEMYEPIRFQALKDTFAIAPISTKPSRYISLFKLDFNQHEKDKLKSALNWHGFSNTLFYIGMVPSIVGLFFMVPVTAASGSGQETTKEDMNLLLTGAAICGCGISIDLLSLWPKGTGDKLALQAVKSYNQRKTGKE